MQIVVVSDELIHALSLELLDCICSKELDFFRCSFSSSSKLHMLRLWIWTSSYMTFKVDTVFRLGFPGEVAPIDGVEKPSEDSSCEGKDTDYDL